MHVIVTLPDVTYRHRIAGVSINARRAFASIETTTAQALAVPGGVASSWRNEIEVPIDLLGPNAEESVAWWLASADGPYSGGEVVDDAGFELVALRSELLRRVKQNRARVELGGLVTPFGPVDTDADSQRKISGAALMALVNITANSDTALATALAPLQGPAFELTWRMSDNSLVPVSAQEMIIIGMMVGDHVAQCQMRKNALDQAVTGAATLTELQAIDPDSGWPHVAAPPTP